MQDYVLKKLKICAICVKNVELCAKLCASITKKSLLQAFFVHFLLNRRRLKGKKIITYILKVHILFKTLCHNIPLAYLLL